jgi:hypothetical protein
MIKKSICVLALSFIFILNSISASSFFVYAQPIEQDELGIQDYYLYNELLLIANQGRQDPLLKLQEDALINTEEISITNSQIQSLSGLHLLNLANLTSLNLSNNNIGEVTSENLSSMPNLVSLDLSNNNLTQVEVNNLTFLNTLNLNNNELSQINIGQVVHNANLGNGYVNLNNNKITTLQNIVLPSEGMTPIIVDLINNYIVDEQIQNYTTTHTLELLFQGVKQGDVIKEDSLLQVYNSDQFSGEFNVKIYNEQDNIVNELYEGEQTTLTANNYELRYFNLNTALYDQQAPLIEFEQFNFTVKPTVINVEVTSEGEIVNLQPTYNNAVTINLSNSNNNATIYYSLNYSDWTQANSLNLDTNGTYSLRTIAVVNDIESDIASTTIQINIALQNAVNVFKAVGSIVLLTALFILGYWYYSKRSIKQ